jgi:hypothetical protein
LLFLVLYVILTFPSPFFKKTGRKKYRRTSCGGFCFSLFFVIILGERN